MSGRNHPAARRADSATAAGESAGTPATGQRLDKWLWAARFCKTRSVAVDEIEHGRVRVNGALAKPGREVRAGDEISIRQGGLTRIVRVLGLDPRRGPATHAQTLYAETPESAAAREAASEARRLAAEPAMSREQGRPTKRDRRQLAEWTRWSAALPAKGDGEH